MANGEDYLKKAMLQIAAQANIRAPEERVRQNRAARKAMDTRTAISKGDLLPLAEFFRAKPQKKNKGGEIVKMEHGGEVCRGMGSAIRGGKFTGVK